MREAHLGSHTVQSHGIKLAKIHMHDWFILIFLLALLVTFHYIHPFHRFVGKDMMTDFRYPYKSSTIPFWAVPILAVVLPTAIFGAVYYRRRDVYDLHQAILGILFSVLITGVITNAIKDAVGRPRPDFFWRCFPDGKELYDQVTGSVICHGKKTAMRAGYKSFPSGHTSWSFAGLTFVSLYLSGKIKVFDRRGHAAKLCLVLLPLLIASLVGISRVDDYKHHWEDVFAGALLGMIVATVCYLQFFPAPYDDHGGRSHAYTQMLEASSSTNTTNTANQLVTERNDVESSVGQRSGTDLDALEYGKEQIIH